MNLSLRLYRATLLLYPADLRRDFGDEMTALFAEDLASAANIRGRLRIWWCCFDELFRIALPSQQDNPVVMVPAIAFVVGMAWTWGPLLAALWHARFGGGQMPPPQIADSFFLLGPVVVAFVGFLVARLGVRNANRFPLY